MKLTLLTALVSLLPVCYGGRTAFEEAKQCFDEYILQNADTNNVGGSDCMHIRSTIRCISKETDTIGSDESILNEWRFVFEQEARFVNLFHFCVPEIDISKLTQLVVKSGIKGNAEKNGYLMDNDKPEKCALDAYQKCSVGYLKAFPKRKLCLDMRVWNLCLKEEAAKPTCQVDILKHFASMYNHYGNRFIEKMKVEMPAECGL